MVLSCLYLGDFYVWTEQTCRITISNVAGMELETWLPELEQAYVTQSDLLETSTDRKTKELSIRR